MLPLGIGTTKGNQGPGDEVATRVQEPGIDRVQNFEFEERAGGRQPNQAANLRPQSRSGVISFRAYFSKAVTNLHKF